jgi:hypothetical protein
MNHIHGIRRLSITLAGIAAAALALPACQATATAMPHHHHATHVTVQPTENGLTIRDLTDLAEVKRDLFRRIIQQTTQKGLTIRDLQDLANVKRDLFRRLEERPADSGLAGCTSLSNPHHVTADDYPKIRAQFAGSRWPDLRTAGTAFTDLAIQLRHARGTDGYQAVWFYQRLSGACAKHGRALSPSV